MIGYVSDLIYEQVRGQVLFFAAQYALARVFAKRDQEWVPGNHAQPGAGCPTGSVERDWAMDRRCTGGHDEGSHLDLFDCCRGTFPSSGFRTFPRRRR